MFPTGIPSMAGAAMSSPEATRLDIPASVTLIPELFSQNVFSVETVTFASPSRIRRLDPGAFHCFSSLRSICIPASVEFIARCCFILPSDHDYPLGWPSPITNLTFERGSKLREIEADAFSGCLSLRKFCIPASVELLTGLSLPPSGRCIVEVEKGNRYFQRRGDFVMSSNDHCIVRYFGRELELRIADDIEKIGDGCFRFCEIVSLEFGYESKVSSIGSQAFRHCEKLERISIPSSVMVLGASSFASCKSLQTVHFCAGSRLDMIPDLAFLGCSSLESIILPLSVKILGDYCFVSCEKLETSPLSVDSEIIRIGMSVFQGCWALRSVFLPSSVEIVGKSCFVWCPSLSSLTFASPPLHLRELLSFPPSLSGSFAIPDSVEILAFDGDFGYDCPLILIFERDSQLTDLDISDSETHRSRVFVQASTESLKRFRRNWEFTRNP
jgi:hypothetical protein